MFIVGFTLTDEAGRKVEIDDTIAAKIKVSLRIHLWIVTLDSMLIVEITWLHTVHPHLKKKIDNMGSHCFHRFHSFITKVVCTMYPTFKWNFLKTLHTCQPLHSWLNCSDIYLPCH